MCKLTALIVDDELLARNLMQSHLEKLVDVDIIGQCSDGIDGLDMIIRKQPDVVFLDIEMPGLSGFELVKSLQSESTPMIIFTTAYHDFAVEAFELNAIDYLLKPFEFKRLEIAFERAKRRKESRKILQEKTKLLLALSHMNIKNDIEYDDLPRINNGRLAINDAGRTTLIPYEDIEWIDAAGDYMCVHAKGETHIIRSTMKDLQEKLYLPYFRRIHRSTMVNLNKVNTIEKLTKGEALLHLDGGTSLKVSRNYRSFLERLQ
ncbi:MAG: two-component system LytT family response regulator [Enterobacterales bacterium]|jgi:two-component system LytT family response regulator